MRVAPLLLLSLPLSSTGCQPKYTVADPGALLGEDCTRESCAGGLVCGYDGVCTQEGEVGTALAGDDCSATEECSYGLVCSGDHVCVDPGAAGTAAIGEGCTDDTDCEAGLYCDDGTCQDAGIPFWAGGACPPDAEPTDPFYVYFDVPDLPVSGSIDFYSLPFPNDARIGTDGLVDLSGHPDPGATAPEVGALFAALQSEATGFARNPTVYFRFNQPQDVATFTAFSADATIHWVSLDDDAPDRGELGALTWHTSRSRGRYICQNWLAVSAYPGAPLAAGHTYAVWLTRGVTSTSGAELARDDGFKLMMQGARPGDLTNARAWDAYAPLRDYLARVGSTGDEIAVAAVFTTADPASRVRYFRELAAGDAVRDTALIECDTDVSSPCSDRAERACDAADPAFHELHGRLSLPDYRGTNGDVAYTSGTGRPASAGDEEACFALTVPPGEPPADGWPVVVVAPDAGRSFRATVLDGVAAAYAARGVATFTLELPAHGERGEGADGGRASYLDGAHPLALRGNLLQAIADPFAAESWLVGFTRDAGDSPTGERLAFDRDQLWFQGEGTGADAGAAYLPWSLTVQGGVLGSPAGHYATAWSATWTPHPLTRQLQASLADAALSPYHPVLALLQMHAAPADPVNHAETIVRDAPLDAHHLLVVDGVDDPDLARDSVRAFLLAADIPTVGTVRDDYDQATTSAPAAGNVTTSDGARTAGSVQYAAGRDVLHGAALGAAAGFVESGVEGEPTITP